MQTNRLADLMKRNGVTRLRLALAAGVSETTVRNWIAGLSQPDVGKGQAIAAFLGVPVAKIWPAEKAEKV